MIRRVDIEHFKRFDHQRFDLDPVTLLAGPNNTGKSSLLQALAAWRSALRAWMRARPDGTSRGRLRVGVPLTRQEFSAVPVRDLSLLWTERRTAFAPAELPGEERPKTPRLKPLRITVEADGTPGSGPWALGMEFRYANSEQLYVLPVGARQEGFRVPAQAGELSVVHVPPFSGIGPEEFRYDPGAQEHFIGQGKAGDILRNLLLETSRGPGWPDLVATAWDLFQCELRKPEYTPDRPHIVCEYDTVLAGRRVRLDIASAGSGFHQVLTLFAFFYARPASVLLLDEPDAHLHLLLQRTVYERLKQVAATRGSQLIVATHAEVLIDGTEPSRVLSFVGARPHRLATVEERDQAREALRSLTTVDLLLADQGRGVLYVESDGDRSILRSWANVLHHPARDVLDSGLVHPLAGHRPAEARRHFFALQAVRPHVRGVLLLDRDNRDVAPHEVEAGGLAVRRWGRYEIENYLLVPAALERFAAEWFATPGGDSGGSIFALSMRRAVARLFPPAAVADPLGSPGVLAGVKASRDILPQLLAEAGIELSKPDYYLIAAAMRPEEIHPDVRSMLDTIGEHLGATPGTPDPGGSAEPVEAAPPQDDGEVEPEADR